MAQIINNTDTLVMADAVIGVTVYELAETLIKENIEEVAKKSCCAINGCCIVNDVFYGDLGIDSVSDFQTFFFNKKVPTDTLQLFLVEENGTKHSITELTTFGTYYRDDRYFYVKIYWANVKQDLRIGRYHFEYQITYIGETIKGETNKFQIKGFDECQTDSVAITWYQKGEILDGRNYYQLDVDSKGIEYMARLKGRLKKITPTFTKEVYLTGNRFEAQISSQVVNNYEIKTKIIGDEMTLALLENMALSDEIYISDKRLAGDSIGIRVNLDSIEELREVIRNKNVLTLKFSEYKKNKIKRYC